MRLMGFSFSNSEKTLFPLKKPVKLYRNKTENSIFPRQAVLGFVCLSLRYSPSTNTTSFSSHPINMLKFLPDLTLLANE